MIRMSYFIRVWTFLGMMATFGAPMSVFATGLTLRDAESRLIEKNRDVQAARRSLESARAGMTIAEARPNPNLSMQSVNISPRNGIGAGRPNDKIVDTTLRLDLLIEGRSKRTLRGEAASKLALAAEQDLAETIRAQRVALRQAYFDLKLAQEKFAISRDFADLSGKTLNATELRLRAGDVSEADAAKLRVDALRSQNDLRVTEAELVKAQFVLATLIADEDRATTFEVRDPWPQGLVRDNAAPTIRDHGELDGRPDVKAAALRAEAAEASRNLARALKNRDISIGVQYEHFPENSGNTWGIGVSIPLFVAYKYEGEIRRADSDWHAAREMHDRTRAQAATDVARAGADIEAARARIERFRGSLIAEAKRAANAAEFAYQKGATGVLELLDTRRTFKLIQLEAASAEADFAKALAAWMASLSLELELQ